MTMDKETDVSTADFLPNFPNGPLDYYRDQASFNWKKMATVIDDVTSLQLKV